MSSYVFTFQNDNGTFFAERIVLSDMIDVGRSPESVHFAMSSYFDLKSIRYAE